ncbi:MAG: hypothetical protein NT018_13065 [Armatimonadetes bacterium]|nr:hypothetical protein [Armatimonadota bacterium]
MFKNVRKRCIANFVLLITSVCLLMFILLLVKQGSSVACPVIVAYGSRQTDDDDAGINVVNILNDGKGIACALHSRILDGLVPLGYEPRSKTWVFTNGSDLSRGESLGSLVLITGQKVSIRTLRNLPLGVTLEQAALCTQKVYVPSVEYGKIVVYTYDLQGKQEARRVLKISKAFVNDICNESIAITKDGLVALALQLRNSSVLELFVINRDGEIIYRIKDARDPQFGHDGKDLAYRCGADRAVILNIKTGLRKIISVWPLSNEESLDMIAVKSIRWDSIRNWLLCAYEERITGRFCPVYAIDIKSSKATWKRLPINVDTDFWILLNEVPTVLYGRAHQ